MAADVRKLLTADVKVGEGGAIGHGGTGLYLQVGREWEGTLGGRQKCRCADRKGVDEYIKLEWCEIIQAGKGSGI